LYFLSSLGLLLRRLPTPKQLCLKNQESQEASHAHAYAQHSLVRISACILSDVLGRPGAI
jgi:hypothetical protein